MTDTKPIGTWTPKPQPGGHLNLGCGRVILPAPRPEHHARVPEEIYSQSWWNVDRDALPGVDQTLNIFQYPWPWADNTFDGALLAHIAEHIPHGNGDVDGFYLFFAELHRVLKPDAIAHILAPYALCDGAICDPTHTRLLKPYSFSYLVPNLDAPFEMGQGGAWAYGEGPFYSIDPMYKDVEYDKLMFSINVGWNVAHEFYLQMKVVK